MIAADLGRALGARLDAQLIGGSAGSGQMRGLLAVSGILSVAGAVTSVQAFIAKVLAAYDALAGPSGFGNPDPAAEAVAEELRPRFRPIPVFVGLTGLWPEEWLALERGDVDLRAGTVHVRRVWTDGELKLHGKQKGSLRAVPLPARAAEALAALPPRLDTRLLFPNGRGGHLDLDRWRAGHWTPAVRAAGLPHRSPYALRHTFASFSIAAGVSLFELARFMGTSVAQIDATYGHLLPDAMERTRSALDMFVASDAEREEARGSFGP